MGATGEKWPLLPPLCSAGRHACAAWPPAFPAWCTLLVGPWSPLLFVGRCLYNCAGMLCGCNSHKTASAWQGEGVLRARAAAAGRAQQPGGGGALRENWGLPASGGCAKIWSRGMARDSYNGTSVCMCGKTGAGPAGRSAGEGGTGLEPQGRRGASPAGGPGCKQSAGQAQQFTGAAVRRRWPCGARRPGRGAAGAAPARGAGRPPHQTATRCPPPAGSRRRRPPAAARRAR